MTRGKECAPVLERISAYLDQELDEPTCRAIDEHCRVCTECAGLVAGLRATIGLCRATRGRSLPGPIAARARAHIARLLASARDKSS